MNTHTVQNILAAIAAAAAAAVPFIPQAYQVYALALAAMALAAKGALSVQSEVAGDKKTAATAAAATAAANNNGQRGFSLIGAVLSLALLGIILTFGVLLNGCVNGIPTPQTQTVVTATTNLALCVEQVYVKDEGSTPPAPITQVIIDEGVDCASQALAVLTAFGQENTPAGQTAVIAAAHAEIASRYASRRAH
jgi:hypothetical protein